MRRFLFLLLPLGVVPAVQAQDIRGVVRDNASTGVITGAIVIVMDSGRIMITRSLTNARGEYDLPRAPEARILRVLRLGFRPIELPIPASAGPTLRLDVNMTAVPLTLEVVRTVAAAPCQKRKDAQAALSLLEQARTGLLATIVTRESKPATLTRLEVIRKRNFETDNIMSMRVTMDSAYSTNSYGAALSAQAFVDHGFATDSVGMLTTYGPDAEVLLDEAFANGYCFRIMDAQSDRKNQIGLGFLAAEHKRGRIEIDGALWIDTTAKALVDIEFLYRGFARMFDQGKPGGHIEFRTMINGAVLIDRWALRVPSRESRQDAPPGRPGSVSLRAADLVVQETGGELARARWADGTTWRASLGTARMHLVTEHGQPDTGRVVRLDSTTYTARSDSLGNLEMQELVPGPYSVSLVDGRLEQIGVRIPTDRTFFMMRDSVFTFPVATRTVVEYTRDLCVADRMVIGSSMILGRVLNTDNTPANRVDITIDKFELGRATTRIAEDGHTGSTGLFHWCALVPGSDILITTSREGGPRREVELHSLAEGVTVIQFKLKEPER